MQSQGESALVAELERLNPAELLVSEDQREAVRRAKGRALVEISGGVTLERLPDIAATGADFVSIGALTHSVRAADVSFELERIP